ncbi:uncharacterized protein [Watersipora subatra]|uniref:uncharacterized protein n=1 Tax=Watersipora subatra TaxID=2589382 RepID=UPI00355B66D1
MSGGMVGREATTKLPSADENSMTNSEGDTLATLPTVLNDSPVYGGEENDSEVSDSNRHSSDEDPLSLSDTDSSDDALEHLSNRKPTQCERDDEELEGAEPDVKEETTADTETKPGTLIPMPAATQLKTSGYISVKDLYASHEQNLRLIEAVKPITFLYDIGGGKFSKQLQQEMKMRWEDVARKTRSSADDCRILWTHLKSEFRAKLKCYEDTKSDTYRRWPYFVPLEFLTPYLHKHRRVAAGQATSKRQSSGRFKMKLDPDDNTATSPTPRSGYLPKRARTLPARLQDYVSNDYISQIEIAQKRKSKLSVRPPSDSDTSEESDNSSDISSQTGDNSESGRRRNGSISEPREKKRRKKSVSCEETLGNEKDAIYVTELTIDGIPTVVIESAITLTEEEQEQILKAAVDTGSVLLAEKTDNVPMQRVSLKLSSPPMDTDLSNFDESLVKQSCLRPHKYQHSFVPTASPKRKIGRPCKTPPHEKKPQPELDDAEGLCAGKNLVVTISDRRDSSLVHCQWISYEEAQRLNLAGFDVDEWMSSAIDNESND